MIKNLVRVIKSGDLIAYLILKICKFFNLSNDYMKIISLRNRHTKKIEKKYSKYIDSPNSYKSQSVNSDSKTNKHIWVFWAQGFDKSPEIVKVCQKFIDKYASGFVIHKIDLSNFKQFVTIPQHILDKLSKNKMSYTHFSDILRTFLLAEYGGVRIDATVLLTGEIPEMIFRSDMFLFKLEDNSGVNDFYPNNWFLYSKPHFYFFETMKKLLTIYREKENYLLDYTLWHIFADIIFRLHPQLLDRIPTLLDSSAHLFQKNLLKKYDSNVLTDILNSSSIHKLTYKFKNYDSNSFLDKLLKGQFYDL